MKKTEEDIMSNGTISYYDNNAEGFFAETVIAEVEPLRRRFLAHIPDGGRILDLGCGSGRDAKCFMEAGYSVDAVDGSKELCRIASEYLGFAVRNMDFFDLNEREVYHGIWACASLLHVNVQRLPELFSILSNALLPGGVLYASFKYGDYAGQREGRFFLDLTEQSFQRVFDGIDLKCIDQWRSQDVRRGREVDWLNVILKKPIDFPR